MKPSARPRLAVPAALSVSILAVGACSPPTMPGPCVTGFVVPPGATRPTPGVRPVVDIAPCPETRIGVEWTCIAANGCQVNYVGGFGAPEGAPIERVFCVANGSCLWGIDAEGRAQYGACPQLPISGQECINSFLYAEVERSGYSCSIQRSGCTLSNGNPGHEYARVAREVTGVVDSTPCPATCMPYT